LFDGASCVEAAKEKVDGVVLCERHALEVKLEGQIECWGEMLFHIDLWSREARRRERPDVVELLQDQPLHIGTLHREHDGGLHGLGVGLPEGVRGEGHVPEDRPSIHYFEGELS
jgi:hypothetical protein